MSEPTAPAKTCSKCGEILPLDQFGPDRRASDGLNRQCRACCRSYSRQWRRDCLDGVRQVDSDRWRENGRRVRERNRAAVFDHYGHVCACCGTTERLTIDHINGGGKEHGHGSRLYRWLRQRGFPDGFQTLCLPCNVSKHNHARCRIHNPVAIEEEYEEIWKRIIENPDGSLNRDHVMRELADYSNLMRRVRRVFEHVTGGRISWLDASASTVIRVHDQHVMEVVKRALAEEQEASDSA